MRIGIYGTGGAGGHFGARLARAGEDVVFIARGEDLAAIRRDDGQELSVEVGDPVVGVVLEADDVSGAERTLILHEVRLLESGQRCDEDRVRFGVAVVPVLDPGFFVEFG